MDQLADNPGLIVAIGLFAAYVVYVIVDRLRRRHEQFNKAQMELISDSKSLSDIGLTHLAHMLASLACLNVRDAIRDLKAQLKEIRSKEDALAKFKPSFMVQLPMRLANPGEQKEILDVIASTLRDKTPVELLVAQKKVSGDVAVTQETTTKVAAS